MPNPHPSAPSSAYLNLAQQYHDSLPPNSDSPPVSPNPSASPSGASVNYITFNQNASCVAIGVSNGYKIYSLKPVFSKCILTRREDSVGLVEMLYCTSLVALVALGNEPGALPRKLKVVNTKSNSIICELVFPSAILAVKMSRSRMVVLLDDQIYIYDILSMRLLHTIETSPNVNRLCTLSDDSPAQNGRALLAYPSPPKTIPHDSLLVNGINTNGGLNSVQNNVLSVSNAANRVGDVIIFDLASLRPMAVIEAHKSGLAAMCLSSNGLLLATASNKGTIVRVFNVHSGEKLYQFRRGTYPTRIYSLAFSADNNYVVATSASETVHIFRLGEDELLVNKQRQKRESKSKKMKLNPESTIAEEDESAALRRTEDEDDIIEDDGDDSDADAEDDADAEADAEDNDLPHGVTASGQRKLSQGSVTSFNSTASGMSGSYDEHRDKSDPVIDQNRLSVARIIRRSSQTLGRKAAQKMGDFLPSRFSSILEPTRHFASLKIQTSAKDVKSIAMINNGPQRELVQPTPSDDISIASPRSQGSAKDLLLMDMIHINVVTSEGYFYTYGLDPERGGDCILLQQFSLLDD